MNGEKKLKNTLRSFFVKEGMRGKHFISVIPIDKDYRQREADAMVAVSKLKAQMRLPLTKFIVLPHNMSPEEKDLTIMNVAKARGMRIKKHDLIESDIPAQAKWEENNLKKYADILREIGNEILRKFGVMKKAKADEPFQIKGRVYISPVTRRPLLRKEWNVIESSLTEYLNAKMPELVSSVSGQGHVLGALMDRMHKHGMDVDTANYDSVKGWLADTPIESRSLQSYMEFPDELFGMIDYSMDKTADNIKGLNDKVKGEVKAVINNSLVNGDIDNLQSKLQDRFAGITRDWRKIALTEGHNAMVGGHLTSVLDRNKDEEFVYVRATGPTADICWHCQNKVVNKVFRLLPKAPEDPEQEYISDENFGRIGVLWPGKDYIFNAGKNIKEWRVVYGSQHPHCRHRFVETTKLVEDMRKKQEERLKAS